MARQRTYPLRVDEIERLRAKRGLSLERLATSADIHPRTLGRLLKGGKAYLKNIAALAEVLKVAPDDLRADVPKNEIADEKSGTGQYQAQVTVDPTMQDYLPTIREIAQLRDDMSLIAIKNNGALVVIGLSNSDAWLLINSAINGKLLQGKVKAVVIPELTTPEFFLNFAPTE